MLYQNNAENMTAVMIVVQNIIFVFILLVIFKILFRKYNAPFLIRVANQMAILFGSVSIVTGLQYTILENNILTYIIIAPIIVILAIGIIYSTTKIIENQYV